MSPAPKYKGIWEKIAACGPSRAVPPRRSSISLAAFIQPFHLNELLHLLFQHKKKKAGRKSQTGLEHFVLLEAA